MIVICRVGIVFDCFIKNLATFQKDLGEERSRFLTKHEFCTSKHNIYLVIILATLLLIFLHVFRFSTFLCTFKCSVSLTDVLYDISI